MHRVLKPENFLFVSKHENSLLKTIDLDSPCYLSKMMFFTDVVGRPYYVAPEADVWSAGVIVLLSGVPPSWLNQNKAFSKRLSMAILTCFRHLHDLSKNPPLLLLFYFSEPYFTLTITCIGVIFLCGLMDTV
ncbi:hypothetical protein Bca4012_013121 [Brassica carinata]